MGYDVNYYRYFTSFRSLPLGSSHPEKQLGWRFMIQMTFVKFELGLRRIQYTTILYNIVKSYPTSVKTSKKVDPASSSKFFLENIREFHVTSFIFEVL